MDGLFALLKKIQAKPGLYMGTASITNLRMFLIGYRFARAEMGIANADIESDFYKNFQPWLQARLSARSVHSWDKIILMECGDDRGAFHYFFQLLEEFCRRDKKQDIEPILARDNSTEKSEKQDNRALDLLTP